MSWEAAGAVGEIVGAAAVVISVIYLAVQIKRQTEQAKLAATRELMSTFNETLDRVIDDPVVANLWLEGAYRYRELANEDRIRVSALYQRTMRVMEQQHLHVSKGHIDPVYVASIGRAFADWITKPGVQQWWGSTRDLFEAEFRKLVDDQISEAKARGYSSSYLAEREAGR